MRNQPRNSFLYGLTCCILFLQLSLNLLSQSTELHPRDSMPAFLYSAPGAGMACGTDILLEQRRKDPAFAAREKATNQAIRLRSLLNTTLKTMIAD